jgi:hypothetical protein
VQAAEKTYASFEITATNAGRHSSLPHTENTIYDLADAIEKAFAHSTSQRCGTASRCSPWMRPVVHSAAEIFRQKDALHLKTINELYAGQVKATLASPSSRN